MEVMSSLPFHQISLRRSPAVSPVRATAAEAAAEAATTTVSMTTLLSLLSTASPLLGILNDIAGSQCLCLDLKTWRWDKRRVSYPSHRRGPLQHTEQKNINLSIIIFFNTSFESRNSFCNHPHIHAEICLFCVSIALCIFLDHIAGRNNTTT